MAERRFCKPQVGVSITSSSPKYADAGDRTSGKMRLARYPAREFMERVAEWFMHQIVALVNVDSNSTVLPKTSVLR